VDHAAFLKAADAGQLPPVVLLHGPEPLLLEEATARATQGLFPDATDLSLAREALDVATVGAQGIVQAALVLPWFGARRLVVARGVDALGVKPGAPLAAYIAAPNPTTVLLLLASELLPAGHWLARPGPGLAVVPVPRPGRGRPLVGWLRTRARRMGVELADDAALLLIELTGEDLSRLSSELDKAATAAGQRRVGVDDVRAVVGEHRVRHLFDLGDALARRETGPALSLLDSLLGSGEDPIRLVAVLTGVVRLWWETAEALRQGRSEDDVARGLRGPLHAREAVIARARTLSAEAAARHLTRCWTAERRLKLSGPPRPEVSLLVAELCTG
jgi:DNA polymerase-3 subunit delta